MVFFSGEFALERFDWSFRGAREREPGIQPQAPNSWLDSGFGPQRVEDARERAEGPPRNDD
jgi:hypothetical protein